MKMKFGCYDMVYRLDIEILKPYIVSIGQEEIVFSADIQNLSPEQIKPVERYL